MFSIIVPCYNCEKTIMRCVDSLLNQSCSIEYEIILVNDGSTDNTFSLLSTINNSKVKVYNLENTGAAQARMYGAKKALFEYILFVDSDDYVSNDYLETYLVNLNQNAMLMINYEQIDFDKKSCPQTIDEKTYTYTEIINLLMEDKIGFAFWRFLFKKSYFCNIEMNELTYTEDSLFILEYILKNKLNIYFIKKCVYLYDHTNLLSITNNLYCKKNVKTFILIPFVYKKLFDKYEFHELYVYLNKMLCFSMICLFRTVKYKSFKHIMKSYSEFKKIKNNKLINKKYKFLYFCFKYNLFFIIKLTDNILRRNRQSNNKIEFNLEE